MLLLQHVMRNQTINIFRNMAYYAVANGRQIGIFDSWSKCEAQVKGFKGAKYKKFPTRTQAEQFLKNTIDCVAHNSYDPINDAVPLNQNTLVQVSQSESAETEKDFWPESEEDENVDEIELELTAALAEVEGIHREFVPLASSSAGLKRKYVEETKGTSTKIPRHVSKVWEPTAVKRFGSFDFEIDEQGYVIVYTDGSCFGNGTDKACAGFGVYFGDEHPLNAAKPVIGRVTNNVGEIQAAIYAIKIAHDIAIPKLCISTDSQFLINAITLWVRGWKRNNWQLKSGGPVKNVADFRELDELLQKRLTTVKWNYVNAHKGIKGNEMADKLAREGSILYKETNSKK